MKSILIANRGEIAIRIAHAVTDMELRAVMLFATDDADSLHVGAAENAVALPGRGPAAYLDLDAVVSAAIATGCDAVHPGYGFLSENVDFASACAKAGLVFIGPDPAALAQLGDKVAAIELAKSLNVPVIAGLTGGFTADQATAFLTTCPDGIILKAANGGGGRGMRVVHDPNGVTKAIAEVSAEALAAFGDGTIFVEQLVTNARHIEVQVLGDSTSVCHLWERDCSLQRRHQKVIEIAPAPNLDSAIRQSMLSAACKIAQAIGLRGLATIEFLLDQTGNYYFIEANPRLQVEHTITEMITGIDLVQAQIKLADGASLKGLGLHQDQIPAPIGTAIQMRISCERLLENGSVKPTGGVLRAYVPPGGPGIRVDGAGFVGMKTNPAYDGLLAKLIVHSAQGIEPALRRAKRALGDFKFEGVETNKPVLAALLDWPELGLGQSDTGLIAARLQTLVLAQNAVVDLAPVSKGAISAPMQGTVLSLSVTVGEVVAKGARMATLEAMKMQHAIVAPYAARVLAVSVTTPATVPEGAPLFMLEELPDDAGIAPREKNADPNFIRSDLAELQARRDLTKDAARPDAVKKRHALGKRMARENIADLCDPDTFVEFGDMTFAAQRARRTVDDLIKNTPADGLVTGFGRINGTDFGPEKARCAVMAYDYTVLAGTQGVMNHAKKDRILDLAYRQKTPLIFYCEGGGGRPGDVDAEATSIAGLHLTTFWHHARLSSLVPVIGIGSGRVFAGNAALLGCCDVVIATRDSTIGMGGPAMIEGGGLGVFTPDEVGPSNVQAPNGVIDILVEDEVEATKVAKKYLGYFQGSMLEWQAPDPHALRHVVPENRLEVYDVHKAIDGIADEGSSLELRAQFAPGMVTIFARVEGRPVGILANNPLHLAGAIDSPCADKATRFVRLCDAFDIPIISLIDTPGMMVGPEVEKTALVRHCARLFLAAGNVTTPFMSIVLRKGYGLGAMVMAGGSFRTPLFIASWPSGEFGGMGLEGAVRLGYRRELEAVADPAERHALYENMVAAAYERGKALNAAAVLEIDTVIDPAETRAWIVAALEAAPLPEPRAGKKHSFVDAW